MLYAVADMILSRCENQDTRCVFGSDFAPQSGMARVGLGSYDAPPQRISPH